MIRGLRKDNYLVVAEKVYSFGSTINNNKIFVKKNNQQQKHLKKKL